MKVALIAGIYGQDGYHLANLLLNEGYQVHGIARPRPERPQSIAPGIKLHLADLGDQGELECILETIQPDEIYNLASQSFVPASWREPILTAENTAVAVARLLEGIRRICPDARLFQASSSEMFGNVRCMPQDESTPFSPCSPYGTAKLYAHHITVNYRETHGLYAASGILFNHEGPRRNLNFVTRKITHTVARIKRGLATELRLGNLEAKRDWGYAGDYVRAMWLMLQQDKPEDFVIGTGEAHSVNEFVAIAFTYANLDWRQYVVVDPRFYRPAEEVILVANNAKAQRELSWQPETSFEELVRMMVDADLEAVDRHEIRMSA